LKESKSEELSEMLETFKIQLGKYHKIVINKGIPGQKEKETEETL